MTTDSGNSQPVASTNRRRLIKGLALGTGAAATAPTEWTAPVVRMMITPAHGQAVSAAAGVYTFDIPFA